MTPPYRAAPLPAPTADEVERCRLAIAGRWSPLQTSPVVLLAYASSITTSPWLLGVSAALHGLPLAVVGLGATGGWHWAHGGTPKLAGSLRAVQLLDALARTSWKTPVALLDAFDTFIANAPSQSLVGALARLVDTEVVLGGECMHFPVCRIREMHGVASYRACIASGLNSCAPNGGYLLGHTRGLERLLVAMLRVVVRRSGGEGTTRYTDVHDQGALHEVFFDQAAARVSLQVDGESRHILNLHACSSRQNLTKLVKGFSYCRERYHLPMARALVPNASAALYWPRGEPRAANRRRCAAGACEAVRPLVVHANGAHQLLGHPKLKPIVDKLSVWPPPAYVLAAPVLLIDSARHSSPCTVVQLGELLVNATWSSSTMAMATKSRTDSARVVRS